MLPTSSLRALVVGEAHALVGMLEEHGVTVDDVATGAAAIAAFASNSYRAVFVHVTLPDMSGCDVASRVRQASAGSRPKLIALTPYATTTDLAMFRTAGFDLHLTAPIKSEQLLASLLLIRVGAM